MEFNWEIIPLLVGFAFSYLIYHYKKFRMGGVLVIPLLAIYTIKYPLMLLIVSFFSIIIFFMLKILMERFIIYGRRLLYLALFMGVILMSIAFIWLNSFTWYSVLLPGLIAYNYHRESYSGVKISKAVLFNGLFYVVCLITALLSFYLT